MKKRLFPLLILLAATACSPSINPALRADVDARAAALSIKEIAYPAPTTDVVIDPVAGSWSTMKVTDKNGHISFVTYKLLERNGQTLTMETSNDSYYDSSVHQITVVYSSDWMPQEFLAYRTQDKDGKVTDMEGPTLSLMNSIMRSWLPSIIVRVEGLPREDAIVAAGTFQQCGKTRYDAQIGFIKTSSEVWLHPTVPFGSVKSVGDNGTLTELVDFGTSGATAAF